MAEDCLIVPEDLDGFIEMRKRVPWQTLATGEHWYAPSPFSFAASHRSVDILQPDVNWVGGITACMKIYHLAEAAGITLMPHAGAYTPYGQHMCYAMPNIPWGEYFVGSPPGVPLEEAVTLPGMSVPKNGYLVPNDAPGFGIEVKEEWIEGGFS